MNKSVALLLLIFILGCSRTQRYTKHLYFTMGTVLEVTIPEQQSQFADSIYSIFHHLDFLFHPTNPSSDVSKINRNSGTWVRVSKETADCIKKSLELSQLTNGEFDITIGKLVGLWHFEEEGKYIVPQKDSIEKYRKLVNYRKVKVKGDSVFIGRGQRITLSGIAKGYALDIVKKHLAKWGISSCIINAGGDMLVLGTKGGSPWRIGIQSPWGDGYFKIIEVKDRFVATSGNYVRYIKKQDTLFTHIFNPMTGEPLEYKKLSVTIIAQSGYLADGLATALSAIGEKKAVELADSLGVGLIAVYDNDTVVNSIALQYVKSSGQN